MKAILVPFTLLLQVLHCCSSNENALHAYLLRNYTIHARPVVDKQKPLSVTLGIEVIQIMKFAEEKQEITIKCWLRMSWYNEFMMWDPRKFGNVYVTRLGRDYVWTPDIYMHGGLGSTISSGPKMYHTVVRLQPSGLHTWFVPVLLPISCAVDLKEYPFDHQSCLMNFGSWTNDKKLIDIKIDPNPILSNKYLKSLQWTLKDVDKEIHFRKSDSSPTPFVDVQYTLRLVRLHDYYMMTVIAPCIFQMICILATFFFPPDCGERITSVVTVFVVFGLYLSYLSKILPKSSDHTPLLSRFLMTLVIEGTCALLATIIVLLVHFKVMEKGIRPVPDWVRIYIMNLLVKYFGIQPKVLSRIKCPVEKKGHYSDSDDDDVSEKSSFKIDGRTYTMTFRTINKTELKRANKRMKRIAAHNDEEQTFFDKNQNQLKILNEEVCNITEQLHKMEIREEIEAEWHTLVTFLDRVFVLLFFFTFAATLLVYWVIPSINFRV